MSGVVRLATRGSPLARWQAEHVAAALVEAHPGLRTELVVVSTEGDRRRDVPLSVIGGKGVFVKEVQAAVLDGRADVAVHSAKDLPAVGPEGLVIAAVPRREDPRDAMVGAGLDELVPGAVVATGSRRRAVQLLDARPDLAIVDLRGNIDTRVARVGTSSERGEVAAVVVACAALDRLGRADVVVERLDPAVMLPQVGQGALAVECRADDDDLRRRLGRLEDRATRRAVDAERAFLEELGGDCDLPAGAFAEARADGSLRVRALLADDGGLRRIDLDGTEPEAVGRAAAEALRR